jgi:hypothetical protein
VIVGVIGWVGALATFAVEKILDIDPELLEQIAVFESVDLFRKAQLGLSGGPEVTVLLQQVHQLLSGEHHLVHPFLGGFVPYGATERWDLVPPSSGGRILGARIARRLSSL